VAETEMMTRGYGIGDLAVGMSAEYSRKVSDQDIERFAALSGDDNPVHLDDEYANASMFKGRIAHGMLSASFISTIFGTRLPGPGAIYLSQTLKFKAPVRPGDVVDATVEITAIDRDRRRVSFACVCRVDGGTVLEGEALLLVPA